MLPYLAEPALDPYYVWCGAVLDRTDGRTDRTDEERTKQSTHHEHVMMFPFPDLIPSGGLAVT